ncbi:MAG: DUF2723 domain-containing protein [Prevotella sp.]|nr:DUF2723 domain-containing protein [Prevotella sp.]
MNQTSFSKINTCMAWLVFAIAAIVYGLTVEPTASLWDCPEFIACGYKLEIGHPPGAPVFMLAANLFSQLASDPSHVALMVNLLSALLSAGCIFFLFLTVTHLSRKLICPISDGGMSISQVITIEACGMVGALAYTFSDTFWFSAVEAEVYAFSSFLTALMFWLILKWESEMDKPSSTRWIVLIAYITGLSIGVHLLCLLCLPAMSFVVYFRRAKRVTWMGMLKALIAGGLLIGVILFCLIPGVVKLGGWFELLFTNVLGCPYNTGLICYILLLTGTIVIAYYKVKQRIVKLSLACLLMMLIGYSSYGVIFFRANAQTPMCENAPDNIFSLGSYLNREQYGKTPLFYGPAYCSEIDCVAKGEYLVPRQKEGQAVYRPVADSTKQEYEVVRHDIDYVYKNNMYFPRMHSSRHAKAYEDWLGNVEKKDGVPTAAENLRFFLSYQVNFMYWRYFLWNFVGRQNNIQGHGEVEHGNWITGFRWIDDWLLGCDTSKLSSDLKENKGRNVFYGLPLLLGLVGMLWQWRKGREGKQQLLVVMLLFVMTGLAIVVYLNQTPLQPRERDYAYAGSFYAFAIWIGMGVGMISEKVRAKSKKHASLMAVFSAIACLQVPLQMASQTWDDHDRSGRYTCRDFGANYLNSMQRDGHPIILTNGDNDTFPLWYNHEVEGVRTDTRVVNMEYLQTDWYIDQMKRQAYDSPPLPISLSHEDYKEGRMEYVPIDTDSIAIGPATISLKGKKGLYKNELMVLDMLLQANWERSVYMSISMGSDILPFLRDHLVLEGLAYRISPTATTQRIDVERLYDNIMHRFRYGGLSTKGIYVDEDVKRMANTHQLIMGVLIDSLLQRGDLKRAVNVCHKWQKEMPQENVPYTEYALSMARCYYMARQPEQGDEIVSSLLRRSDEWLSWINTIKLSRRAGSLYNRYTWMQTMEQALVVAEQFERTEFINQYIKQYEHYNKQYQ